MRLNDVFEQVRIINLPDRRDRRVQMEAQLKRAGLRADFYPAVRVTDAGDWPSTGARGCFQSHFRILEKALQGGVRNVLVIEDDLDFSAAFKELEPAAAAAIGASDWDLLYLGHPEESARGANFVLELTDEPLMTAFFYAVNGRTLPRLVRFLNLVQVREAGDPLGGPQHFDGALCMFRAQNPDVRTLMARPRLGFQRRSRSDISAAWYDRMPIAGGLINVGRRVRRMFIPAGQE
jgi:hypothetical protein